MGRPPKIFQDSNGQWYWERRVVEARRRPDGWLTDLYESVRDDSRLEYARYIEPSGRVLRIAMDDLRRATEDILPSARARRTFTIDPDRGTVNGQPVPIVFDDERPPREEEPPFSNTEREARRKGWTSAESEWHRQTTNDVADNPGDYSVDISDDPIIRRWRDSCRTIDGKSLWLQLWTQKHPDAVFEHRSGKLTVVEVEPRNTLLAGVAQLVGDYVANVAVDRRGAGLDIVVEGVLVLDETLNPDEIDRWEQYMRARGCRLHSVE